MVSGDGVSIFAQEATQPTSKQVLDNYVTALGGELNLRSIESMKIVADDVLLFGEKPTKTLTWKSGKYSLLIEARAVSIRLGFDGENVWQRDGFRTTKHTPKRNDVRHLECVGITPYVFQLLDFDGEIEMKGKSKVLEHDTWVLGFTRTDDTIQENRHFDIETGLLVYIDHTVLPSSTSGELEDCPRPYRFIWQDEMVEGFRILKRCTFPIDSDINLGEPHIEIKSVEFGVDVDDTIFEAPDN